jgi:diacylglycerol kinase (CTP)
LKLRSELHIARKLYHILGTILILVVYHNVTRHQALLLLTISIAVFVPLDILRTRSRRLNRRISKALEPIMRADEMENLSAMSYLLSGTFIVVLFFPETIAKLSLFLLAVGDPISSIFGVIYGTEKIIGNKTLQGSLAGFFACTVTAALYYYGKDIMTDRIVLASLLTGIIGSISEAIPVGKLDDNFTIPVISSTLLLGLFYLFGAL